MTHASYTQTSDEATNGAPEPLATLAVRESKSVALAWVEDELTRPLVSVCVEHRHREHEAMSVRLEKTVLWVVRRTVEDMYTAAHLFDAPRELTRNVVQDADVPI